MRKHLCSALALLLIPAMLVGCSGEAADTTSVKQETTKEVSEEMTDEITTSEVPTAPYEDESLQLWYVHSFTKTDPDNPTPTDMKSYTVYMGKNEAENAQLVLYSDVEQTGLSVSVSELTDKDGNKLSPEVLREYYIDCNGTRYPDPVAPMNDTTSTFDLAAGKSQAMLIQLKTEKGTAAGDYSGLVTVSKDGKAIKQARVFCHVWGIELPDACASVAVSDLSAGQIMRFHEGDTTEYYKKYYDYLLENRVCAYSLPYDVLDERADAYMSDSRVNAFRVPYSGDDATMTAYYQKLSSNEAWMEKAYFYPYDEPGNASALNEMATKCRRIQELCPGMRIVVPFFQNVQYSADADQIEFMSDYVDIWCPKAFCFTKKTDTAKGKKVLYSSTQAKKYTEFGQRMSDFVAQGDDLWWYVCWEPGLPYLNMFVDMTGLQNRLLFWQQAQYGVEGFLYWACNYWTKVKNPWTNMATVGTDYKTGVAWLSDDVFGDGSYIYPGSEVGVDGCCGSMRLQTIRDGTEDNEMLRMYRELAGDEAADALIAKVTTSVVNFTDSEDALANARIELGNALEAAAKQ